MDTVTLGRRIKEARLAKKMTQNEVVGNFITRNMLSQIESGTAAPSIKTLEYLSQVLEIPVDQLILPEEKTKEISVCLTDSVSDRQSTQALVALNYLELKQEFLQEKYENVLQKIKEFLQETNPYYDEGCAIYARCCLKCAVFASQQGDFKRALTLAKEASRYAQAGCLASRDIKTQALLLLDNIAEYL